jgi:hypothetical protein
LDAAVFGTPHGVVDLLNDVVVFYAGQAFILSGFGDGDANGEGDGAQIVNMREQRRSGLTNGDSASD